MLIKYMKSRTVAWNVAIAVLVAVLGVLPEVVPTLQGLIPDGAYAGLVIGVNVLNVALRAVTTQPLADRVQ